MADLPHYFESPFIMTEVLFKDDQGNWIQTEPFDQELRFNGYSVGYFCRSGIKSGTGFLVKIEQDQSSLKSGIILTAAHVFYKNFVYVEESVDFVLGTETFEAKPITRMFDWEDETKFLFDPVSNQRISIPEDWILCEIWRKTAISSTRLVALRFNEIILSPGIQVFVVGYPKEITQDNLDYVAPGSDLRDLNLIQKSISCGGEPILSSGKIVKAGEMIAISCITANGCSGSPVLVDSNGELKFIGLLHGGPASFLHKGISCLIHNSLNPNLRKILKRFQREVKEFKQRKKASRLDPNHYIRNLLSLLVMDIKAISKQQLISESYMINTYRGFYKLALSIEVSRGLKLCYNLCYPVNKLLIS